MAKANGSIKGNEALAVLIDGRPTIVEEVADDEFEGTGAAAEGTQACADETLVFLCREMLKRARLVGDETLVWLLDAAYKRARGGRR